MSNLVGSCTAGLWKLGDLRGEKLGLETVIPFLTEIGVDVLFGGVAFFKVGESPCGEIHKGADCGRSVKLVI